MIQTQKTLDKQKFNEIIEGNRQADLLAKKGTEKFDPEILPKCNDKLFVITKEGNEKILINQKTQNYLIKKRMNLQAQRV